jgi:hypothetical protein
MKKKDEEVRTVVRGEGDDEGEGSDGVLIYNIINYE